jgi:hypothetical protein
LIDNNFRLQIGVRELAFRGNVVTKSKFILSFALAAICALGPTSLAFAKPALDEDNPIANASTDDIVAKITVTDLPTSDVVSISTKEVSFKRPKKKGGLLKKMAFGGLGVAGSKLVEAIDSTDAAALTATINRKDATVGYRLEFSSAANNNKYRISQIDYSSAGNLAKSTDITAQYPVGGCQAGYWTRATKHSPSMYIPPFCRYVTAYSATIPAEIVSAASVRHETEKYTPVIITVPGEKFSFKIFPSEAKALMQVVTAQKEKMSAK